MNHGQSDLNNTVSSKSKKTVGEGLCHSHLPLSQWTIFFLENIQFNTTFENTWDDFSQAGKGEGNELCVFVKTTARIE